MPSFSKTSTNRLNSCHPDLIRLFTEVIKHYDCIIIQGHRSKEEQDEAYRTGKSKLVFPNSKHNQFPSMAVDAAPYHSVPPHIRWESTRDFYFFSGYVLATAKQLGIALRWGGDWNMNNNLGDQTFFDLPHFELI